MKNKRVLFVFLGIVLLSAVAVIISFTNQNEKKVSNKKIQVIGAVKIKLVEPTLNDVKLMPSTYVKEFGIKCLSGESYARLTLQLIDKKTKKVITNNKRLNLIKGLLYYDLEHLQKDVKTPNLQKGNTYTKSEISDLREKGLISNTFFNNKDFELYEDNGKMVFTLIDKFDEGEEKVLISNIVIPTDLTEDEKESIGEFDIILNGEGVQVEGFTTRDNALAELDG